MQADLLPDFLCPMHRTRHGAWSGQKGMTRRLVSRTSALLRMEVRVTREKKMLHPMKIIAFGASTSRHSINRNFAAYVAAQFEQAGTEVLDLNDYPLPLFSIDLEKEEGIPENARRFHAKLATADLIVISLAEHNGSYTAAFKNLFDWVSRHELKFFAGKKLILTATAPGSRGGLSVLEAAISRFPRHGAEIVMTFSLPNHGQNFSPELGIFNEELHAKFTSAINQVKELYVQLPDTN